MAGPKTRIDPMLFEGTVVYTDGACSGNPGPGGWAWAIREGAQASGGHQRTTNQRMELTAALEAVRANPGALLVMSDSTYVVNCFRDNWWKGWLARGWVNSQKKPVANRDLWEPLIDAVRNRGDVSFQWVKGHSGDEMNDLVDRLAVAAAIPFGGDGTQPGAPAAAAPEKAAPAPASEATPKGRARAASAAAADAVPMLDLFDGDRVGEYRRVVYRSILDSLLRTPRAQLGLPTPHTEAEDDAQRQALDDVASRLRQLGR